MWDYYLSILDTAVIISNSYITFYNTYTVVLVNAIFIENLAQISILI